VAYFEENVASYAEKTGQAPGRVEAFDSLEDALANAWLVIEAVPEKIQLKIDTFAQLDQFAPSDCILASNSSSYKSSEMLEKVSDATKTRILNMHYYMPPQCMVVELMTDGHTEEGIFPFMVERCKEAATLPYVARKQSTGFIFNRLWLKASQILRRLTLCGPRCSSKEALSLAKRWMVSTFHAMSNLLPALTIISRGPGYRRVN
jgi:3-hydroxyacyl-CoA dehydrogenase